MMRSVSQANLALPVAAAFVIIAIAALAVLSARGNHAEAATTITIEVSNFKFCTPGQSPCPDTPLDTTVAAGVGDTISFQLVIGLHTATNCTDGTFAVCTGNLFDFGTGAGDWLIPASVVDSNVYFRCNTHPLTMRALIVVAGSVGGIADFPDIDESPADASGSSEGSSFTLALVSGLVAALAMFAAGAWYARRRWLS